MVVRPAGLLFGDKWPAAALVPPPSPPQQLERQHDSSVTSQTLHGRVRVRATAVRCSFGSMEYKLHLHTSVIRLCLLWYILRQ